MASNKIKMGTIWRKSKEGQDGNVNQIYWLALGNKSKNPATGQYEVCSPRDCTVEVIVRNAQGQVVHQQTDGLISLGTPFQPFTTKTGNELRFEANVDPTRK